MENHGVAQKIIDNLEVQLAEIDLIGAHIAAAHLDAAIEALCKQTGSYRKTSSMD